MNYAARDIVNEYEFARTWNSIIRIYIKTTKTTTLNIKKNNIRLHTVLYPVHLLGKYTRMYYPLCHKHEFRIKTEN